MSVPVTGRFSARYVLRAAVLLLGAVLVVSVALRLGRLTGVATTAPPLLGNAPAFRHVDQAGAPFGSEDLAGQVWVASFLYTSCPGPCPTLVRKLKRIQAEFGGHADFRLVSFSVDPQSDTPEVLAEYAATHGLDASAWSLVTGDPEAVIATVRGGFYADAEKATELAAKLGLEPGADLDPLHGPVVHSLRVALVDRQGRVRGYYDSNDPEALLRLSDSLRYLLANPSP